MSMPINDSFHLQVNHFNHYQGVYSMPASMPISIPTSMSAPMPIPHRNRDHHHYHHQEQQRQRLPYAPETGAASPSLIARGRVAKACENCRCRKVKCDGVCPCERCTERGLQCIYGERKVRGPTKRRREMRETAVGQVSSSSPMVSVFSFRAPSSIVSYVECLITFV
jgi:hypothetical protein